MKTLINRLLLGNVLAQQIFLFVLIGGLCYLISMAVLIPLVEFAHVEVNLANLIASLIAIYAAYILNGKFIFETGKFWLGDFICQSQPTLGGHAQQKRSAGHSQTHGRCALPHCQPSQAFTPHMVACPEIR